MPDADLPTCPRCGAPRPANAPDGLCPRCLRGNGASEEADRTSLFLPDQAGRVLETLAASAGPMPRVLLPDTSGGDDGSPLVQPSSREMPPLGDRPARVQLLGEIARGGMGVVLKGRDPDLGRDLAVKVLREDHRDQPELVRRFVEEAQIAGQLQHPGIVPVYELGCFADARPYFTMKLVKGRTLAQLLADRPEPGSERSRFLGIFEQVAQTMAYAHARGVIHRDLKPSNVMVGSFGEVQVMDWGLAKVLPRGGAVDDAAAGRTATPVQETIIATARSGSDSDVDRSRAGSVLGTPSYMAPEQARGEVEAVDERADVFALGSILCEVLTGQPAFTGRSAGEIQRKAALGDLADAARRLEGCGADGELATLARACLAAEPEDRPRDAGIVVDRLTAYLAGVQERLHAAELARAAEAARAEEAGARVAVERSRRRRTLALAASLLATVTIGALALISVLQQRQEQRVRLASLLAEAEQALDHAERSEDLSAAAGWDEARVILDQAGRLGAGGVEAVSSARLVALRARAARVEKLRALVASLEAVRGRRAEHFNPRRVDKEYAEAFRAFGLDLDATEPQVAAKALAGLPATVEIAAALDEWCRIRRLHLPGAKDSTSWRRLAEVARASDPDPWRNGLRAIYGARIDQTVATLKERADDPRALDAQPVASLVLLANMLLRAGERDRALAVLRAAWRRAPGDFWVNLALGDTFWNQKTMRYDRPEEALRFFTAAVSARPRSYMAHNNLGWALHVRGDEDGAMAEYREALRLQPEARNVHFNIAVSLGVQGKRDDAIALWRKIIAREPESFQALGNLAFQLWQEARLGEAEAAYREALRLRPADAVAHSDLGSVLVAQGKTDEGLAMLRETVRRQGVGPIEHYRLGVALETIGQLEDAATAHREAVRLDAEHVGDAIFHLGWVYRRLGRYDEAPETFRKAADLAWAESRPDQVRRAEGELRRLNSQKALLGRLPGFLSGADRPKDGGELYELTWLCHDRGLDAASARICESAFQADPKLADDPQWANRYNAACSAALAGCGQGRDDPPPDDAEKARLRALALAWLRTDLAAWSRRFETATPAGRAAVRQQLNLWRADPDLIGVREPAAQAKHPEAERREWQSLWAEVDALRAKAKGETP